MNIVYTGIYQYMSCIYQYILVYTSYPVTGFRGGHRDAAMLDASQPPVEQEPEEGDPSPCPEDEEFFVRPDAAGMEEAIGKFLDGLDGQESCHLLKILYTCLYLYEHLCDLKYVCSIGRLSQFNWLCSS